MLLELYKEDRIIRVSKNDEKRIAELKEKGFSEKKTEVKQEVKKVVTRKKKTTSTKNLINNIT
jgi:hypothetical protein